MTKRGRRGILRVGLAVGATFLVAGLTGSAALASGPSETVRGASSAVGPTDWPSFGNGPEHDFVAPTSITAADVGTLHEAWFFPTGDAVTATPTIVNGVAYFGSWDTKFYAVALATGTLLWSYQLDSQTAVQPYPGENPRPIDSDGGLVTSSAWYEPASSTHPDLVIFGGGFTLYALDADTGTLFWKHVYDGTPWKRRPSPTTDQTRIFLTHRRGRERLLRRRQRRRVPRAGIHRGRQFADR